MKNPHTFLLALTFLFLFCGSSVVFADDYHDGIGAFIKKDYETAQKLLIPLAAQGNSNAQVAIGIMFRKGNGVLQDYKEAVKWFRLAAEQGDAIGQGQLGASYLFGHGVPQDYVLAHMWFNLSSSNGVKNGTEGRNMAEKKMSKQQIEKAQELARNWKPTSK